VDTLWSFAVGIVGAAAALAPIEMGQGPMARQTLVAVFAAAWSARLGLHIMSRTLRGGEDPRYEALHKEWGEDFPRRLFWFLQVQAAMAFLLVVSIFVAARNPGPFPGPGDLLGAAILLVAIGGEAIADRQLESFRADRRNKGRVCDVGLWSLSRHPNYFFEWLGWIAYPAIAIGLPPTNVPGALALIAPILMYWLLVHVSGVPPLEAHMARSRGAEFEAYRRRVNAFFPWPARAASSSNRSLHP
jgi:steroid 5-alpha reductase family enzyme